jgi:hypothetical protein
VLSVKRALFVVPLFLLAACSGPSAPRTADSPATPSPPVVEPPSPSAAPSPAASPSASAHRGQAAPGDVDGDGQADTVVVTATQVSVTLSGGGTVSAPIVESDVPKPVVSGLHDLDLDGRNEIWVETARGASTSFVQAYRYDGKKLAELTFEGGHIRFGIGGSVTHGDGFTCKDNGQLLVSTAESDDGTTYRVHDVSYRVSGFALIRVLETFATAKSMDDPRVRAAYQVQCGSVGESD